MMSDHPMCPHMNVEVRLFSSGVVVDRVEKDALPMLITFGTHVEGMWTVDIGDSSTEALRRLGYDESFANDDHSDGYMVVLALKSFESGQSSAVDDSGSDSCIQYNTTERVLPSFYQCRFVAFFVPTSSRHSAVFSTALHAWRTACRMNDIPDVRGLGSGDSALPARVLLPLLVTVDCLSSLKPSDEIASSSELAEELASHLKPYPGHGYLQMRYLISPVLHIFVTYVTGRPFCTQKRFVSTTWTVAMPRMGKQRRKPRDPHEARPLSRASAITSSQWWACLAADCSVLLLKCMIELEPSSKPAMQ
jgi:hypothetical protein